MTTLQFCNALIRKGDERGSHMHSMTAQKAKQGYTLMNSFGQAVCNIRYRGKVEVYRVGMLSLFAISFIRTGQTVSITEAYDDILYFCQTRENNFKII